MRGRPKNPKNLNLSIFNLNSKFLMIMILLKRQKYKVSGLSALGANVLFCELARGAGNPASVKSLLASLFFGSTNNLVVENVLNFDVIVC